MSNRNGICLSIAVVFRALCVPLLIMMMQTAGAQIISTVAGPSQGGVSASGIAAEAIALDRWGNIYTAEPTLHIVRRIDHETGDVTVVAGTGKEAYSGDGGLATQAMLDYPTGVAVDRAGNVLVGDPYVGVVRRVDRETGIITTIAGPGIPGVPARGDGGPATQAALFANDVAVNREGDLYIADSAAERIRRVDHETGIITTVVGDGHDAFSGLPGDGVGGRRPPGSGEGGPARSAGFSYILAIAFGPHDELYVVDPGLANVRRVDRRTDIITTVAGEHLAFFSAPPAPTGYNGDGIAATDALLNFPTHIAFDCAGNLTISDTFNSRVRQVNRKTGIITTLAQISSRGLGFGPNGDLFVAGEARIFKVSGLAPQAGSNSCEEPGHEDCNASDRGNCERGDHRTDPSAGGSLRPWW